MINYEKIARQLDTMVCPIHKRRVTTIIRDNDDPIFLECCCVDFEDLLMERYNSLVEEAIDNDEG